MTAHVWELLERPYRHYTCDGSKTTPSGLKIGSVTQVLGTLDKPALPGWAANVTGAGCLELARPGTPWRRCMACWNVTLDAVCQGVKKGEDRKDPNAPLCLTPTRPYRLPKTAPAFMADVRRAGLDHNSTRDEAAFRGTTVHEIFERWVKEGAIPNPHDYRPEWQGYVRAVSKWILHMVAARAKFEVAELIVGSTTHGFAGTCDTVAITESNGQRIRWDLKTSRQCYAKTHFRQLGAYELASVEMGLEPTDDLAIVVLRPDGTFKASFASEVEWDTTPGESFLRVLRVWRDDQPLIKHEDAEYKARRAEEKGK